MKNQYTSVNFHCYVSNTPPQTYSHIISLLVLKVRQTSVKEIISAPWCLSPSWKIRGWNHPNPILHFIILAVDAGYFESLAGLSGQNTGMWPLQVA